MTLRKLSGIPDEDTFATEWLPLLPQAARINRDDALRWREAVADQDPERFAWHFRRLAGIGGSEIGEIVQASFGMSATFKTPRMLALQKLMALPPDPPSPAMRRGILMEPAIQRIFCEDWGAEPMSSVVSAGNAARSAAHPWAAVNIDDAVMLDGRCCLVDYKAPSNPSEQSLTIYAAQLHLSDYLLATGMGFHQDGDPIVDGPLSCDGLLNVYFDYERGAVLPVDVPYSAPLAEACLSAGDTFWAHVVDGVPLPQAWRPEPKPAIEFDALSPEDQTKVDALESRCLMLKLATVQAEELYRAAEGELLDLLRGHSPSGSLARLKAPTQAMALGTRTAVDKEAMEAILKAEAARSGLREDDLANNLKKPPSANLDEAKARAFIERHAANPSDFYQRDWDVEAVTQFAKANGYEPPLRESTWMALGRSKAAKALVEEARGEVAAAVRDLVAQFEKGDAADEDGEIEWLGPRPQEGG
ncbi:MAG: hypothetical protein PHE83_19085 [Opitutaceae bacterium]|nr:hypothetical protein [Opitutaceae bacterium]